MGLFQVGQPRAVLTMKILVVARCKEGHYAPFVAEQVQALEKAGATCRMFPVQDNNYLSHLPALKSEIRPFRPDLVHAHYGLCGFFANLQRRVPVVTTYHGSDINDPKVRWVSRISIGLSAFNVFVSQRSIDAIKPKRDFALVPCGVDLDSYQAVSKVEARGRLKLDQDAKYILFAGAFDNPVKNAPLAREVAGKLPGVQLLELKGYSRPQVALLMQAADALLMTSVSEGSPQVIKEGLACGLPVVSVDVGDVRERTMGVEGCYISSARDPEEIAGLLETALSFEGRTKGRAALLHDGLTSDAVAGRLLDVYKKVLAK